MGTQLMSDETKKIDELQKNLYENNLLEIYKLLLILRNIVKFEKINRRDFYLNDPDKLIEEFVTGASYIKEIPLYFSPDTEISDLVQDWLVRLNEVMYQAHGVFNSYVLKSQKDLITVRLIVEEIINYFNNNKEPKAPFNSKSYENKLIAERFRSLDITYDNILMAKELSANLEQIKINFNENLKQSENVKEIFTAIENQYHGFNAFVEKNYNDETKKIYDAIYKHEYGLADNYRNYATIVFIIIAIIATLNFLVPTIEGIINYFKIGEFKTSPIDVLFFLKAIFMLLLTAPGWYFARESSKHRQVAYKAKIISSELSALPFYLADLDVEDRREMRKKMADKFFGQELYNDKKNETTDLSEQTKATTETLKVVSTLLNQQSKTTGKP